jgi:cytochrome P450
LESIVDQVIDEVIEAGECDLVADIAGKLASYVMADLLGIPRDQAIDLYAASDIVNNAPTYEEGDGLLAITEILGYAAELFEERRLRPRDDVITRLATGEVEGCPVDGLNFNLDFLHLVTAAGDTTRNVIAGGMEALFDNPTERCVLTAGADDPELISSAVEEMLRWVSPIVHQRRTATIDTEIAGQAVKAGQKVVGYYGIANRDPAVFSDPYCFDIRRSPNQHIAFGFGTHFCLGAHLARAELKTMFASLLRRIPDLEPTGPSQWVRSNASTAPIVVGPRAMPVRFTSGRRSHPLPI